MSVSSGFYDSLNGDRKYNAEQMSSIFDGLIEDGVYAGYGDVFSVTSNSGLKVNVGIGRCWFNHTWVLNDAILPLTFDTAEVVQDRYDAIVIEIDRNESVRAGSIKIIKGTPSTNAEKPTLTKSGNIWQYPIAYVKLAARSSTIKQSDIENQVGTSECPYVTGIISVHNIDNLVEQWGAQFNEWFSDTKTTMSGDVAGNLLAKINKINNDRLVNIDDVKLVTESGYFVDALVFKNILTNADLITEQSTNKDPNTDWVWEKYESGKAICYRNCKMSNAYFSETWGWATETAEMTFPDYPFTFSEKPTSTLSYIGADQDATYFIMGIERNVTTVTVNSPGKIRLVRPGNSGNPTIGHPVISVYSIGRWK